MFCARFYKLLGLYRYKFAPLVIQLAFNIIHALIMYSSHRFSSIHPLFSRNEIRRFVREDVLSTRCGSLAASETKLGEAKRETNDEWRDETRRWRGDVLARFLATGCQGPCEVLAPLLHSPPRRGWLPWRPNPAASP